MNANLIKTSTAATFEQDVLKSSLPSAVYFYSDDSLPCATFGKVFVKAAETYGSKMNFIKVFRPHNRSLAEQYNIKASPTVMFFSDGQEFCSRLTGYINYPEFRSSVEQVQVKSCDLNAIDRVNCDVLIVGAGPAGLTAAIYAARSKLYTVVLDTSITGGQVSTTFQVANYPGTNGVVRGLDLMENMKNQATTFGSQIEEMQNVLEIDGSGEEKTVRTDNTLYTAKALIIATGALPRKLPIPEEKDYRGMGIHYCATCDGAFYQDADVLVVGGGISAVEEAEFLTRYAKRVTIVNRSDKFKAPKASIDELMSNPTVSVIWNSVIAGVSGDGFMTAATIENVKTGEKTELKADGAFIYIGLEPATGFFQNQLKLSANGHIITDERMMTSIPGVFAAGDVREKEIRQISTAVSDGTIAGVMAERYINGKN